MNWDIEKALFTVSPMKGKLKSSFQSKSPRKISEADITDEIVEDCFVVMAEIVELHGDVYLPLFQRLHDEMESRRSKKKMLELARSISVENQSRRQQIWPSNV